MLPKLKKLPQFFWVFFKNFDFCKILNFDMDQDFRMKLSSLILKNYQPELEGHGH